jgi:riboflavin kinase/FMN adenylyltransferase
VAKSDLVHSPCVSPGDTISGGEALEDWEMYASAVNIGVRPTFDGQTRLVEAHLLDVEGLDLYDRCVSIHFMERLRSEQRFAGLEALKAQIAEDVKNARLVLQ